jgi:hypothetical protein
MKEIIHNLEDYKNKNQTKHSRVSSYLGSDNVKLATFNIVEKTEYKNNFKITSNPQNSFDSGFFNSSNQKNKLVNRGHTFKNNTGFYF